jgi:endo-1,4-beta-xylanase
MNMKKLLCLLLALLFLLTACNNQPEAEPAPAESDPPGVPADTAEEPPASDPEPSLTFEDLVFPEPVRTQIFSADFTDGVGNFRGRGGETLAVQDGALVTSGRTANWNGPIVELSRLLEPGAHYEFSAKIKYDLDIDDQDAGGRQNFIASLQVNAGAGNTHSNVFNTGLRRGEWEEINGSFTAPDFAAISFYFEGGAAVDGVFSDIYLAELTITLVSAELLAPDFLPAIYETFEDYFSIGVAIVMEDLRNPYSAALIAHHFNSITMGNEMKPSALLNHSASAAAADGMPVIRTEILDECLIFARDNNLAMRGHTLVWHSQTPLWFFKEGYSQSADAEFASREVMLARMENYIEQVLSYCQENFPGIIYAWDVVNEAIHPSSADPNKIRDTHDGGVNPWYHTVGSDYVEMAFRFAREYAAPEVKLFYNDYNEWFLEKAIPIVALLSDLKEKGLVDGMGMQAHIGIDSPSAIDFQSAMLRYAELGIEIQITELDINLASNSDEDLMRLAVRYKRLMNIFRHSVTSGQADITNVTVWGLSDRDTWLSYRDGGGRRFPLLFDDYMYPKLAFWGFILDDSIPNF